MESIFSESYTLSARNITRNIYERARSPLKSIRGVSEGLTSDCDGTGSYVISFCSLMLRQHIDEPVFAGSRPLPCRRSDQNIHLDG